MEERLQKLLSAAGVCSRRTAETYLTAGRVTVNGQTARLGQRADPDRDEILVDGRPLAPRAEAVYILLNKPRGYVSTLSDERGRKTVAELVADCGTRVYPVGRLDLDSEGLLLLTNDGAWAQHLLHPKHEVEKTYHVSVPGGGAHPPRPGGGAAGDARNGGAGSDHPRGEEPAGPPDVRPVRPDGEAAAPGSGGSPGAGRPAAGKVAVFDTGRGRGAGSRPLTGKRKVPPHPGRRLFHSGGETEKSRKAV